MFGHYDSSSAELVTWSISGVSVKTKQTLDMSWHICAVCRDEFKSEHGLKIHVGKKHQPWEFEFVRRRHLIAASSAQGNHSSNNLGVHNESSQGEPADHDAMSAGTGAGSTVSFPTGGGCDDDDDDDADDDDKNDKEEEEQFPPHGDNSPDNTDSEHGPKMDYSSEESSVASSNSSYCFHDDDEEPPQQGASQQQLLPHILPVDELLNSADPPLPPPSPGIVQLVSSNHPGSGNDDPDMFLGIPYHHPMIDQSRLTAVSYEDYVMARLYRECDKVGAPKYLCDSLFSILKHEMRAGGFDPRRGITQRKAYFPRMYKRMMVSKPEAVPIKLHSGKIATVYRFNFHTQLQNHLLSSVYSDLKNLDLPNHLEPFSSIPGGCLGEDPPPPPPIPVLWIPLGILQSLMSTSPSSPPLAAPIGTNIWSIHLACILTRQVLTAYTRLLWNP